MKELKVIKHRFRDHLINPEVEILIIGTFNPDTSDNPAEFFYGRIRNFLWRLLPTAFNSDDLKGKSKADKIDFISKKKVDFIDLIEEVRVEIGNETNYNDAYIDGRMIEFGKWRDIIAELKELKKLKKVCFTRKSFSGIPEMKRKIEEIKNYCDNNHIQFKYLTTPARFYRADKQQEWTTFFTS